ncbi:MAG: hypothetical protein LQ342_005166 [Letrouitia transgressa]|nr:MAG: hypothetical protein LQ342_005166 [Letrouitia transgressa]
MSKNNNSSKPNDITDAPLPREKLPDDLQRLVDNEESLLDQIYDGTQVPCHRANESTDSNIRYAAYASRLRTILLSAHRYVAYTSDIGESFRPVAHPWLVKGAYGISWAYLIGDVSHEGYKAYLRNQRIVHPNTPGVASARASDARDQISFKPGHVPAIEDYKSVMAQRAVFQSIASMGLPAFTIHSVVRYSGKALKNAKNPRIRTWGPIGLGLAAVPFLPFVFDKPVEEAVEWGFHKAFEAIGGPEAVRRIPPETDREKALQGGRKAKEKEL